jgi:hypothetical protein
MSLRKIFFVICMTISALCLATGYGSARQWMWALAATLMAPAWLFARKYANTWLPLICLLASVGLAVAGRLTGAPSLLMIFSSGFSLAAWDLLFLEAALRSNSSGEQTRQYENEHFQSLALALGSGLFVGFFGRLITLHIPFALLVLFVVLAVFALDRALSYIKKWHMGR